MYQDKKLLEKSKELYSRELQNSLQTNSIIDVSDSPILVGLMVGSSTLANNSIFYSNNNKFLKYVNDVDKHGNSVFDYIRMRKLSNDNEIINIEEAIRNRLLSLNIDPDALDKRISNKRILNDLYAFEKELEDNYEAMDFDHYFDLNYSCLMY